MLSRYFLLFHDQTIAEVIALTAASWPIGQLVTRQRSMLVGVVEFCPMQQWHWPQSKVQESAQFACKNSFLCVYFMCSKLIYTLTCVSEILHIDQSLVLSGIHILLIPGLAVLTGCGCAQSRLRTANRQSPAASSRRPTIRSGM